MITECYVIMLCYQKKGSLQVVLVMLIKVQNMTQHVLLTTGLGHSMGQWQTSSPAAY